MMSFLSISQYLFCTFVTTYFLQHSKASVDFFNFTTHKNMLLKYTPLILVLASFIIPQYSCAQDYYATQINTAPVIDGVDNDVVWDDTEWNDIAVSWWVEAGWRLKDNDWSGGDYAGKFKCLWSGDKIYILAEIVDDILNDDISDPFDNYWDEDLLEVFIDEDNTGGIHSEKSNAFNAFAYHLAINNVNAIDNNYSGASSLDLASFIKFKMKEKSTHVYTWEVEIPTYTDAFSPTSNSNPTRQLSVGETIGLSVAYCEDDGNGRENFFGSVVGAANTCSKNADKFGDLKLNGPQTSSLSSSSRSKGITIFPNPSTGIFNISCDKQELRNVSFRIMDIYGNEIYTSTLSSEQASIDLSSFKSGMYLLVAKTISHNYVERIMIR